MVSELDKEKSIRKDVQGEYNKIKESFVQLTNGIAQREPVRGIYSDCFLLHARNLVDFLCNKAIREDDVIMGHFIKDSEGFTEIDILPIIPGKLDEPYKRINKQASHITYSRLDKKNQYNFFGEDKYYQKIFVNIQECIKKYNNKVTNKNFEIII
jgi:hypothetical protein